VQTYTIFGEGGNRLFGLVKMSVPWVLTGGDNNCFHQTYSLIYLCIRGKNQNLMDVHCVFGETKFGI